MLGPDDTISELITTGVSVEQRAAIGRLPVGHGVLGALIDDAGPVRLRNVADDPGSVGFPPNHPQLRSFLGVPVAARGRVFGNLYLGEKQGAEEFGADDERALVVLAAQAGVAMMPRKAKIPVNRPRRPGRPRPPPAPSARPAPRPGRG